VPDANYFDYANCPDGCQCFSKFTTPGSAACLYSFDYSKPCTTDAQCLQYGSWYPLCLTANFTRTPGTGYCASNNSTDWYGTRNIACARGRAGSFSPTPIMLPSSSPRPTITPPVLACPDNSSTIYTNTFGTQFSVHCGYDLYDPDPELRTVQPNFQSCIDDCDRRFVGKCPGVTWVSEKQWCYFKPSTAYLQPAEDTLWSAVKLPGPEGLTCPQANGSVYTDAVYNDLLMDQYFIYCGFELVDPSMATRSRQLSFEACINDCHEDPDCDGVTWRPNGEDQKWCYHKSRSAVVVLSLTNGWSAQKIHNNVTAASSSPLSIGPVSSLAAIF
jgi:hypothetical protein